ncbi:MAG: PaaI family thioesterase [Dehalococcoidales bacterium]|nr:PaaI family thioesterase [Dehalococcoidales bacterium]
MPKVILSSTDLSEGYCFGCGQNNPFGLKLTFIRDGDGLRAEFTPGSHHQGWPGLLHGGILGCLFDEAMSNAAYATGNTCLTASMNIRIRQPIKLGVPLVVTARVSRMRRKIIETAAEVRLRDGTIVAEATAKQFIAENGADRPDRVRELRRHV